MLTKTEANYRLPDKCCFTCCHSDYDQYGEPACMILQVVARPFPEMQDNNIDKGGICDMFEAVPEQREEVQAQEVAMVSEEEQSNSDLLLEDCVIYPTGLCDKVCKGCADYKPLEPFTEDELNELDTIREGFREGIGCIHFETGACDMNCQGCPDFEEA